MLSCQECRRDEGRYEKWRTFSAYDLGQCPMWKMALLESKVTPVTVRVMDSVMLREILTANGHCLQVNLSMGIIGSEILDTVLSFVPSLILGAADQIGRFPQMSLEFLVLLAFRPGPAKAV